MVSSWSRLKGGPLSVGRNKAKIYDQSQQDKVTFEDVAGVDEARAELKDLKTQVGGYKSRITDLGNQLGEAQAEVKNREEQVSRLKDDLLKLDIDNKRLSNDLIKKQEEVINK